MPNDQVTIDPEFRPPPPGRDQARGLRMAGVVGVVAAAFAFGWFLRSPESTEVEPDDMYNITSSTSTTGAVESVAASTTTRPSTTTSEPPEMIGLEVPLNEAIPGFTDIITMEQWNDDGVDVMRWQSSQSAPETIASFGHAEESWFSGLDASGTWYSLRSQTGILSVHRLIGVDAELPWFPSLQQVGVRVVNSAWHDTEPGQLAWLACSRIPGGPGTLFRLDTVDGTAGPIAVRPIDKACSSDASSWLQRWGDWGFVLGVSEGEAYGSVLLTTDGSEIRPVGDDSIDVWLVAGNPDGTLWTDESLGTGQSSFMVSPDGQSRMPVPGLADGEWLEDALWTPDGTRLALAVRASAAGSPVARIVDPRTAAIIAEITEIAASDWETELGAWSTDGRFLVLDSWWCPDECAYGEPQGRELAFYDTVNATTTVIGLSSDGGWGGVLLSDSGPPAELVAHYPLDGDVTNLSGYDHQTTVYGATPTNDRFGTPDAAYAFDGEDDRITIDMQWHPGFDTVSIAAWIKMHDTANPGPAAHGADVVSYGGLRHFLAIQGDGAVLGGLKDTGADCELVGGSTVFDGGWHHVAMTRDANWAIRVYLDGVVQAATPRTATRGDEDAATATTCATASAFAESAWIGADPGHRDYFHGSIDDVRIYSGTLTDDEVAALATTTP